MLDSTVVALALPGIRHDVGATSAGLQWVMNGYLLAITVFVVTAGRLGDMFGRKRLFLAGMIVFAAGSVVSGAAGSQEALIAGRILQGIGAAPMLPLSLAIVCNAFPASEQARALGIGQGFLRWHWPSAPWSGGSWSKSTGGRSSGSTCRWRWPGSRLRTRRRPSRPTPAPVAGSTSAA
jgi:MFS family permease